MIFVKNEKYPMMKKDKKYMMIVEEIRTIVVLLRKLTNITIM